MKSLLVFCCICLDLSSGFPQEAAVYATLVRTKGYVVGSKLAASGLYRFERDTAWTHLGWNNPRVYGIALDPSDPDIIYLACGNGVLRTRDGGQNWKLTTDWRITEALDVAVDHFDPDRVYVATSFGIWSSENGGDTWVAANRGLERTFTQAIRTDLKTRNRAIAGTERGLYHTIDPGKKWALVGADSLLILDIEQNHLKPDFWVAGIQNHGVLISQDNGLTWKSVGGKISGYAIYDVAFDHFNADLIAAGGWDSGVFISADGGETWSQDTENLPSRNIYALTFEARRPGNLWVAPIETGIFLSTDSGRTFEYRGLHGTLVFALTAALR